MIKIFGDEPRRRENIYIALSLIIGGLIPIIVAISIGFIIWQIWIIIIVGIAFILIGTYIFYKNKGVLGLDRVKKFGDMTTELYNATEKKLYDYLKSNAGTAFTVRALLNRLEKNIKNPNFKKYVMKNGERILNKMVTDGKIQTVRKNEQIHYFFKGEI